MKLADLKAGEYSREITLSRAEDLEAMVLDKLLSDKLLPEGAWTVDVRVNVTVGVKGTKEEVCRPPGWTVAYHVKAPVEVGEVGLVAKGMPLKEVEGDKP